MSGRSRELVRLRRFERTRSYELSDDEKDRIRLVHGSMSHANVEVVDPQPNQRIPKEGSWVFIIRRLPPIEGGINQHLRPGRAFWVHHTANSDDVGFKPDGRYQVVCPSPWGDVVLHPHEYAKADPTELTSLWAEGELIFHQTQVSDAEFNSIVFYCMSRGIHRADAVVMALGTLSGPVGWFEPRTDLAHEFEAMVDYVHRWPPLGGRKRRRKK